MTITLWVKPQCVQCDQTKREFDKRGIIYRTKRLDKSPKAVERFIAMGLTAAPIVETDDRRWSGFRLNRITSLERHLKTERMRGLNVPLEPIKQVADEVDDEPTPEEIVAAVKQDTINGKFISTVWLGVNYNYGEGKPLVFETMIFPEEGEDKWQEEYCERYSTLEEAIEGHRRAVALIEGEQK